MLVSFFFFNDTATTEIYTLSLHDALPIYIQIDVPGSIQTEVYGVNNSGDLVGRYRDISGFDHGYLDRKSTRLNSSHGYISYAVFCLKKKKKKKKKNINSQIKNEHT